MRSYSCGDCRQNHGDWRIDLRRPLRLGGAVGSDAEMELRATIARIVETRPFEEWASEFEAADVPFAPARRD